MKTQIKSHLKTEFEERLFLSSLAYLENQNDPLRLNSFAYSLRELIRNVFELRAPEEKIKSCAWFRVETENGKPSRKQRYIFIVQGGLEHSFVRNELGIDILEPWKEIKSTIDSLSKYTHINESTFDVDDDECRAQSDEALNQLLSIFEMMEETRGEIHYRLSNHIDNELISTFVSNSMPDIDALSNNSYVEHSEVTDYQLLDVDHSELSFEGEGIAHVSQNYGKGMDACEIKEEYPFSFKANSNVNKPYDLSIPADCIVIDVREWSGEE